MLLAKCLRNCMRRNDLRNYVKTDFARTLNPITCKFWVRFGHQAAFVEKFGEPLVIKETESKQLKESEVRIAVRNCGVNAYDLMLCQGQFNVKLEPPFVPGYEVSGEVLEIGSKVEDISSGDKVIALSKDTFGGFAEECTVDIKDVWKMPDALNFQEAAALADSYTTALIAARRVNLQPDDTVLVTAAAGGLGLAAVDIAANLFEAKVMGICGTEDKASLVRDKGAFSAMSYRKGKLLEEVNNFTDGKGVKVIFDAVGGDIFKECLTSVAMEGSIIIAGFASHEVPHIFTSELLPKSCALIGISLMNYRLTANDIYRDTVKEVIEMCKDEYIEPHVSKTFGLEEINEAFKYLQERKSTGKVVIDVQ